MAKANSPLRTVSMRLDPTTLLILSRIASRLYRKKSGKPCTRTAAVKWLAREWERRRKEKLK